MRQAVRDAVADVVRYWSGRTEILLGRLLRWLGIPSSNYYDWRKRYGAGNRHDARIPRSHWLLDGGEAAIPAYRQEHPAEGYCRPAYVMLDADVVATSPSSICRVLREAGRLGKGTTWPSSKGCGFPQPGAAHEHRHSDVSHPNIRGTLYHRCSLPDGYSRDTVHRGIRESMTQAAMETTRQRARAALRPPRPRIISDDGPQFVARDVTTFIRLRGRTHVRTSPFHPQRQD